MRFIWVWIQYPLTWLCISSNYRKCHLHDVVLDIKSWTHNFPSGIMKALWAPRFSAWGPRNLWTSPCRRFCCTLRFEIHSRNSSATNSKWCFLLLCSYPTALEGSVVCLSLTSSIPFCFVRESAFPPRKTESLTNFSASSIHFLWPCSLS